MKQQKNILVLAFLVLVGFSLQAFSQPTKGNRPLKQPRQQQPRQQQQSAQMVPFKETVPATVGSTKTPLYFGIGMHIEPAQKMAKTQSANMPERNYETNAVYFSQHEKNIRESARIVKSHQGLMTVQAQSPFTTVVVRDQNTIFKDLVASGHEIALHFHEDAHLGKNSEIRSVAEWTQAMKSEIDLIKKAGVSQVSYFSGGNLYPGLLQAASQAGLSIMGDYKNPKVQMTDPRFMTVNPWRPKSGPSETDLTGFATHETQGPIIYLPDGVFPDASFGVKKDIKEQEGLSAYFDYLTQALTASLSAVQEDKVNIMRVTIHPGELERQQYQGLGNQYLDAWLAQVVDPLVKAGKIQWATNSQMAQKFKDWEATHPGVEPRSTATIGQTSLKSQTAQKAYVSFVVNVHDIKNVNDSANSIKNLVELFQKNNVKGDFYFTEPILKLYEKQRPEVVALLKNSNMTISYHVRPPHPTYPGFDGLLKNIPPDQLLQTLTDYETYELDLTTGGLNKNKKGGYRYVQELLGRSPVTVPGFSGKSEIQTIRLKVLKDMGAGAVVLYHESGTPIENPLQTQEGLLIRPSDFSITRWKVGNMKNENFWWNMFDKPEASEFNPTQYFKKQLANWTEKRAPFVTVIIHENNLYRGGATPWQNSFFQDKDNRIIKQPPYDLNAPDASKPRSEQNKKQIWDAYAAFVEYAAKNLDVVTSEDLVTMAQEQKVQ